MPAHPSDTGPPATAPAAPAAPPWPGERWYSPPYVPTRTLFYAWVRSALAPSDVLLDAGAGPGDATRSLRGSAARVCGIDVDPAVLANPNLDEARVVTGCAWPYPNAAFDVVLSDYVLEHLDRPAAYLAEARRVLKPGGHLFFRTVNALHPGVLVGRWLPLATWARLIRWLSAAGPAAPDPYPTFWRANTPARVLALLRAAGFRRLDLRTREEPPRYLARLRPLVPPAVLWERVANRCAILSPLRLTLYGCAW